MHFYSQDTNDDCYLTLKDQTGPKISSNRFSTMRCFFVNDFDSSCLPRSKTLVPLYQINYKSAQTRFKNSRLLSQKMSPVPTNRKGLA